MCNIRKENSANNCVHVSFSVFSSIKSINLNQQRRQYSNVLTHLSTWPCYTRSKFSKWHAHRWCFGSWYWSPSSSSRMASTSMNSTSSSPSDASQSSPTSSIVPSATNSSLLFSSCWPKTRNALTKYDPLSVVVLTTFRLISYSAWMSVKTAAKASNVWEPLSWRQARAAERRSKQQGSSQWAVTPIKLLLLAV